MLSKTVLLRPSAGGTPPRLAGGRTVGPRHRRREMSRCPRGESPPVFRPTAAELSGRSGAVPELEARGDGHPEDKGSLHLFPWRGDEVSRRPPCVRRMNLRADTFGGVITLSGCAAPGSWKPRDDPRQAPAFRRRTGGGRPGHGDRKVRLSRPGTAPAAGMGRPVPGRPGGRRMAREPGRAEMIE